MTAISLSGNYFATSCLVMGAEVRFFAQSHGRSTANMIESKSGIYHGGNHPVCGKWAYIDFWGNEIFSAVLAAYF